MIVFVVPSLVAYLLATCRPRAVARAVSGFIVDPFERQFGAWLASHVGQERRVAFPRWAYSDPPAAVVVKVSVVRVLASLSHVHPRNPFGRPRVSVRLACRLASLFSKAAAGSDATAFEIARVDDLRPSAVAQAKPVPSLVHLSGYGGQIIDNESTKSLARKIELWIHRSIMPDSKSFANTSDQAFPAS